MTYKEMYEKQHPNTASFLRKRGMSPAGCPGMYFEGGLTMDHAGCFEDCDACWNAEAEE